MDKTVLLIILAVVLAGALFWLVQSGSLNSQKFAQGDLPQGIVLFYGQECSHCKIVEDFIKQNGIEEKVKFSRLEVWHNQANALLLGKVAKECGQDISQGVPVPFLYDPPAQAGGKGKCIIGDTDSINFFKEKAGIK